MSGVLMMDLLPEAECCDSGGEGSIMVCRKTEVGAVEVFRDR
jgi:hypothetical protein